MGNHCACLTNENKDGEFENMTDAQNMRVFYIIKIQSAMRTYLAQRKVNKIRNPVKKSALADHAAPRVMVGMLGDEAVDNLFPNSLVKVPSRLSLTTQEIYDKMGPFVYQDNFKPSGRLVQRQPMLLDNGIKYKGEWYAVAASAHTRAP